MTRRVYLYRYNGQELYYSAWGKLGSRANCEALMKEGNLRYGRWFPIKDYDSYKSAIKDHRFLIVQSIEQ